MTAWFRVSRDSRGPGPHLNIRIALFFLGAGIAAVGMAAGIDWLVYLAIAVLLVALLLKFASRRPDASGPNDSAQT